MTKVKSIFSAIGSFSSRRYMQIILVSLLICAISILTIRDLSIDSDVLNLLPENNEYTRTFKEIYREFGSFDQVIMAVTVPEDRSWMEYTSFIEGLSAALERKPTIASVEYKIPDLFEYFRAIIQKGILFFTPEEFELFKEKISDEAIRRQMKKNRTILLASPTLKVKKKIELDPLDFFPIISRRQKERERYIKIDVSKGYLLSKDQRAFAVLIKPKKNPQDIKFDRLFVMELKEAIKEAQGSIEGKLPEPDILYYGGHLIALEESDSVKKDLIKNIITSVVSILVLFLWSFRGLYAVVLIFYPITFSILLTFGIMNILHVELSAAASGFTAILVGLGVDYSIIMYNRYIYERKEGINNLESCKIIVGYCGKSIFVGAITTSFSFFALLITQFRGLSQLGWLTGSGILITMISTFFLVPALLTARDRFFKPKRETKIYFEEISNLAMKYPKLTLIIVGALTVFLSFNLTKVTFDENFMKLRAGKADLELARTKIQDKFMSTSNHMSIIVEGDTGLLDINQKVYDELLKMKSMGKIAGVDSIQFYLNSTLGQKKILKMLEENREELFDYSRIERSFKSALEENKFRIEPFLPFLETIKTAISPAGVIGIDELDTGKYGNLLSKYIRKKDSTYKIATYVYPNSGEWVTDVPSWFIEDIKRIDRGIKITGINLASKATKEIIKADALKASSYALIVVVGLIFLSFWRLRAVLIILLPLLLGLIWMFGLSGIFGQAINLVNVFSVAMILGVGVDYGVHIFHRYQEVETLDKGEIVSQGKGITLAALTTILGFASLALSSNPGVSSLGVLVAFGVISTWLIAMTVLPAIFKLMTEK